MSGAARVACSALAGASRTAGADSHAANFYSVRARLPAGQAGEGDPELADALKRNADGDWD